MLVVIGLVKLFAVFVAVAYVYYTDMFLNSFEVLEYCNIGKKNDKCTGCIFCCSGKGDDPCDGCRACCGFVKNPKTGLCTGCEYCKFVEQILAEYKAD